jgi:hypothetical protein
MLRALWYLSLVLTAATALHGAERKHNYMPPAGCVPDAATAIKIAVAIWEPIYGAKHIAAKKPFHATLHDGIWSVYGSLPKGWVGGVPEAEISQKDGKILRVRHGK